MGGRPEVGSLAAAQIPLCVDLDGTLLKSDLLLEGLMRLPKDDARALLRLPWWLARGKAAFKAEIAAHTEPNGLTCPVHEDFLEWLSAEHRAGRRLVLCTGAARAAAERVAVRFGLFDEVISSDDSTNLSGKSKAARLVQQFGERGFDYPAMTRATSTSSSTPATRSWFRRAGCCRVASRGWRTSSTFSRNRRTGCTRGFARSGSING